MSVTQIILLIGSLLFVSIFFVKLILLQYEKKYENHVFQNVSVNGIDVGGKTKQEVAQIFQNKNKAFENVKVTVIYLDNPIATFSGKILRLGYDGKGIADRAYLIGRSTHMPSRYYQQIATFLNLHKFNLNASPDYIHEPINAFVDSSETKYNKPAKNALFKFENNRVVSFRQEEDGLQIESDLFKKNINTAVVSIETHPKNKTIKLTAQVVKPEVTLAESNEFGIEELIAEGKSDYSHSIPGRIHNVILAASKFNGILIPKGATFSFNETIGDISSSTGYQPAYIIKNGKTVLGDGGGVCQVSTTLFRAALNAGLPIVERTAHAYRVGYYENDSKPGLDATIFSPSVDLKIQNDTPASILIETDVDEENNILTFKLFGKKDNRLVTRSDIKVYDYQPAPPPLYQDDFTLKKGVVNQVDYAASGAKASFDYQVSKDGKITFSKTFYSAYRPWQAVFLVGQAD